MARGMLRLEPRCPDFLANAVVVVSAIAGNPLSSVSAEAGNPNSSVSAIAEIPGLSFTAMERQKAIDLQIAHAFGPLDPKIISSLLHEAEGLDQCDIFKEVRERWIRLLWTKRRADFVVDLKKCSLASAKSSAYVQSFRRFGRNALEAQRLTRAMNQAIEKEDKETPWWRGLEEELVNRWLADYAQNHGTLNYLSLTEEDYLELWPRDLFNHLGKKQRERFKANPSAILGLELEFGDPLTLLSEKKLYDTDDVRCAEFSGDPQEKWVKISDAAPMEIPKRRLVFPARNFGQALEVFFSVEDTDFQHAPGYAPKDVWLLNFS